MSSKCSKQHRMEGNKDLGCHRRLEIKQYRNSRQQRERRLESLIYWTHSTSNMWHSASLSTVNSKRRLNESCASTHFTVWISNLRSMMLSIYCVLSYAYIRVRSAEGPATHLCMVLIVCRGYEYKHEFAGPPRSKFMIALCEFRIFMTKSEDGRSRFELPVDTPINGFV